MGSQTESTVFHLTGFRKFQGVPVNPTETIITKLPEYMAKIAPPLPAGASVGSYTVLQTAGKGALGPLIELLEKARVEGLGERQKNDRVLWVSFILICEHQMVCFPSSIRTTGMGIESLF